MQLDPSPPPRFERAIARVMDLVLVTAVLPLTAPVFGLLALATRASGAGPILYRSERIGPNDTTFYALKFRTMTVDADEALRRVLANNPQLAEEYRLNHKLKDDPRITKLGRFLRISSLDELPQLINVLLGDMALVGPRPKLLSEGDLYGDTLPTVLRVRPGLTGLWQTSGRNNLSFDERIVLDVRYATTRSIATDLRLLLKTVGQVLSRDAHGAY